MQQKLFLVLFIEQMSSDHHFRLSLFQSSNSCPTRLDFLRAVVFVSEEC